MTASAYNKTSLNGTINESFFGADRISKVININGRLGLDFEMSKRTMLGLLFSGYDNDYSQDESNQSSIYQDYKPDTLVKLTNDEVNYWKNYAGNINLQHNLRGNGKLSFNFDYIYYLNDQPVNYRKRSHDNTGNFIYASDSRSAKNTAIDFWVAGLDFSTPLSKNINLEAGVKQTISAFTNDISFENFSNGNWIKDKSMSAIYDLKEDYTAFYTSFNVSLDKKTDLKTGLRYEHTNSNLGTVDLKDIVNRHYGNLFPGIFLSHKITEKTSLSLSYTKRITRPAFTDLAPFRYFLTSTTILTGNPALQPAINHSIKADYVLKHFLFSLSVSHEANAITGFQPQSDSISNQVSYTPQNLRNQKMASAIISIPVIVNHWWSMQYNLTGNWQQVNAIYEKMDIRISQANLNLNLNQRFTLPKNYYLELSGFYQSPSLNGVFKRKAYGSLDLGFKKTFSGRSGTLVFNASNILNSYTINNEIRLPSQNLVNYLNLKLTRRNFKLTYSKNFGKDKLKSKRTRTTGAEDEKSRVN